MIHIFIGTKAQYIKTAPFIRFLDRWGTPYNLIDSGQHARLSSLLRQELGLREPDVQLRQGGDIATPTQAFVWLLCQLGNLVFRKRWIREHVFRSVLGVCVIHGDTPSTLLSVLFAKRAGLKVAHIEAGLRSHNYFHPFPEELIRVIAMKLADLLFAPTEFAYRNLCTMGLTHKAIRLPVNTNLEAMEYALSCQADRKLPAKPYAVATLHRVETILVKQALDKALGIVVRASKLMPVVFVLHPATSVRLRKVNFFSEICCGNVGCIELLPHTQFIHLINSAEFVMTDGGSIQEECYYLGIPCLLLRKRTERDEGLGRNVAISDLDPQVADNFFRDYHRYRWAALDMNSRPSEIIYKHVHQLSLASGRIG